MHSAWERFMTSPSPWILFLCPSPFVPLHSVRSLVASPLAMRYSRTSHLLQLASSFWLWLYPSKYSLGRVFQTPRSHARPIPGKASISEFKPKTEPTWLCEYVGTSYFSQVISFNHETVFLHERGVHILSVSFFEPRFGMHCKKKNTK